MVYTKGRFVIHYKDGTTYIEKRNDPQSWDKRPRKTIKALGIQPDPVIILNQITTDPKTGKEIKEEIYMNLESTDPNVKFVLNEIVLKGSFKFDYGFFIGKLTDRKVVKGVPRQVWGIRIGVVVDNLGHCYCLEYVGTGSPRGFYTTVKSLDMDENSLVNNFDIHLEELPSPEENKARYPEINPLVLQERKERWKREAETHKESKLLKRSA